MLVPRPISSISTRLCAVALLRMFAASVISSMNVERPPARSSDAPMRVNTRSIGPMRADARRHVAADAREDHDQRRLAHERRFAAHVRAGDDEHAPRIVQLQIVRHERLIDELLDDRMAAFA